TATRSGFSVVPRLGPREEKSVSAGGVANAVTPRKSRVICRPAFAVTRDFRSTPSGLLTNMAGSGRPSTALGGVVGPVGLLDTIAAMPPAAATLLILSSKLQLPRSTRTTLPVAEPAGSAEQARPVGSTSATSKRGPLTAWAGSGPSPGKAT